MRRLTGILTRFRRPRRRVVRAEADRADRLGQVQLSAIRYLIAQEAVREADLALRHNERAAAEQAINRAASIDPDTPRLAELRAWLAWQAGRADLALRAVGCSPRRTPRLRLLGLMLQCQTGQRLQAQLELADWARQPHCPAAARLWLALLEWQDHRPDRTRQLLTRHAAHHFDPNAGMLLALLDLLEDRPTALRQTVGQLMLWFARQPLVVRCVRALSLERLAGQAEPDVRLIEQLAGELMRQPQMIATLVVAQRCRPRPGRIELFRRALARIVNDLADPQPALEALAELSELAGDDQMARLWAIRGLKDHPYSARLAMTLDRLDGDGRSPDEQVISALRAVLRKHQNYPDVRRALIRRYQRAGLNQLARRQARHWLASQPDQPLARQTAQEFAA